MLPCEIRIKHQGVKKVLASGGKGLTMYNMRSVESVMGNRLFVNSIFLSSASRAMFWFLFRLNGIIIIVIKMISLLWIHVNYM